MVGLISGNAVKTKRERKPEIITHPLETATVTVVYVNER